MCLAYYVNKEEKGEEMIVETLLANWAEREWSREGLEGLLKEHLSALTPSLFLLLTRYV